MRPKLTIKIIMLALLLFFLSVTPGFSEISVYDANDQYLGVLIAIDPYEEQSVFIPQFSLPVWFEDDWTILKAFSNSSLHFETNDCSGISYIYDEFVKHQYIFKGHCDADDIYYSVTNIKKTFIQKSVYTSNCECLQSSATVPGNFIEVSIIPKESFPFTLPIATPVHLKYTSGGDINSDGKIGLEEAVNALQVTSGLKK